MEKFEISIWFMIWKTLVNELWRNLRHLHQNASYDVRKWLFLPFLHTVRNIHFLSKNSTLISRENCRFLGVKNSWKRCGFGLFSCWQLWFHEKNCQKIFGWKARENVGVLSKLNFWTKNDFKNLKLSRLAGQ